MYNFLKLHACGNNFLVFFLNKNKIFFKKIINKINLNCDQLLIIKKIFFLKKIIKIKIFNNNLLEAQNCGNGIRCLSWYFSIKKKFFLIFKLNKNYIYSIKYIYIYTIYKIPKIKFIFIRINNFFLKLYYSDLINIHLVIFIKNINSLFLNYINKKIIFFFGNKYNIEFIKIINKSNFFIRIFENYVNETYSCGSGIICAANCIKNNTKIFNYQVNSIGGNCFIKIFKDYILIYGKVNFCFLGKI